MMIDRKEGRLVDGWCKSMDYIPGGTTCLVPEIIIIIVIIVNHFFLLFSSQTVEVSWFC